MLHSPVRLALTPCTQEELYNPVDSTTQEHISRACGICDCARGELFSIGDVPKINCRSSMGFQFLEPSFSRTS